MTEPYFYDLTATVDQPVTDGEIAAMLQRNTFLQARSGRQYTTIPRLVARIRALEAERDRILAAATTDPSILEQAYAQDDAMADEIDCTGDPLDFDELGMIGFECACGTPLTEAAFIEGSDEHYRCPNCGDVHDLSEPPEAADCTGWVDGAERYY